MRLRSLADKWKGETVYVVGTGPSARVFPSAFLRDKCCIGLNKAWMTHPVEFSVTVHPEHITEYEAAPSRVNGRDKPATRWVTKAKTPLADLAPDDPRYYVFKSTESMAAFGNADSDELFVGRGIQTSGIDLALRMGASAIVLVGVDMGVLGGHHHATAQHVRFNGLPPKDVYREYYDWTAVVRDVCLGFGVPVLSLSAMIGEAWRSEDYKRLSALLDLPDLPPPVDTSHYKRERTDKPPKPRP